MTTSSWLSTLPHQVRETLAAPQVTCDIEVSVCRDGTRRGWVQLHSGQALRDDVVAAVSSAGAGVQVAWWPVGQWQDRLTVAASVPAAERPAPTPARGVEVPLDVLLGAGEALRTHRVDILDELVARALGVARTPAGELDAHELRDQLLRLHHGVVGRLLATVAAHDSTRRAGWVSWLLFADGWRTLTPTSVDGRPSVRVDPVAPAGLGSQVARLVAAVRGHRGRP